MYQGAWFVRLRRPAHDRTSSTWPHRTWPRRPRRRRRRRLAQLPRLRLAVGLAPSPALGVRRGSLPPPGQDFRDGELDRARTSAPGVLRAGSRLCDTQAGAEVPTRSRAVAGPRGLARRPGRDATSLRRGNRGPALLVGSPAVQPVGRAPRLGDLDHRAGRAVHSAELSLPVLVHGPVDGRVGSPRPVAARRRRVVARGLRRRGGLRRHHQADHRRRLPRSDGNLDPGGASAHRSLAPAGPGLRRGTPHSRPPAVVESGRERARLPHAVQRVLSDLSTVGHAGIHGEPCRSAPPADPRARASEARAAADLPGSHHRTLALHSGRAASGHRGEVLGAAGPMGADRASVASRTARRGRSLRADRSRVVSHRQHGEPRALLSLDAGLTGVDRLLSRDLSGPRPSHRGGDLARGPMDRRTGHPSSLGVGSRGGGCRLVSRWPGGRGSRCGRSIRDGEGLAVPTSGRWAESAQGDRRDTRTSDPVRLLRSAEPALRKFGLERARSRIDPGLGGARSRRGQRPTGSVGAGAAGLSLRSRQPTAGGSLATRAAVTSPPTEQPR